MIEWGPALYTGNAEIDAQHQRLFNLFKALKTPLTDREELLSTTEILDQISDYIHVHFSFEEQWMKDIGYPDLEAHQREHADFVEQNLGFLREHHFGGSLSESEIARYLERWLIRHISGTDLKIAAYAQQKQED